jgi:hypothetical protein
MGMSRWRLKAIAGVAGAAALLGASGASAADCFAGLRDALVRGGFLYSDCRDIDQKITYVGHTKPWRGHSYYVYMLTYRTTEPGVESHYGDRVLIFDAHHNYLGHYHLESGHKARIQGTDVVLNTPAKDGNRIHLGRANPPDPEYLDADLVGFAK